MENLLDKIPAHLPEELITRLFSGNNTTIERIVSRGHRSPEGFWYDQEKNEFVLVISGSAGLRIENREEVIVLKPGEYLNIEAGVRHRVEWTDAACDTIWLAVHY